MKQPKQFTSRLFSFQIIRYLVIGFFTTLISFGLFWLLLTFFTAPPNLANFISVFLAVLFAYFANKVVVFKSRCESMGAHFMEIVRFVLSRGFSIFIELAGVFVFMDFGNFAPLPAKALTSLIVLIVNYLSFRYFVFRSKGRFNSNA
jgi:putative flippase GtrA